MIYDRENISIPILCPLQFKEPVAHNIYTEQARYMQPLVTGNMRLCVLISEELYNSSNIMSIKMLSYNDDILKTVNFYKKILSDGYYYATATFFDFAEAWNDNCVYFKIYDGENVLADSVYYMANPTYQGDIKNIKYTHNENEWDTIFIENINTLNIPINNSYQAYFGSVVLTITETKYIITFTLYDDGDPLTILSPIDFAVYYNDISIGNVHTETVSLEGTEDYYVVEIDKSLIKGSEISILALTTVGNDVIFETEFMLFGDSFTSELEYSFDVECGVIPMDLRDEQEIEDFIQQDMVNETIYGETYGVLSYTFGDSKGIPFWLAQKINRASLCDEFFIEGEKHLRIKGAKIEKTEDTENGLAVYKLDFQTENTYLQ